MTLTIPQDLDAEVETIDGVRFWRYADGTLLAAAAGGDDKDDEDDADDKDGDEEDADDADKDDADDSDDDSEDGDDDDDDDDDPDGDDPAKLKASKAKLKAALDKERTRRKAAEKKAKPAPKPKDKPKPKSKAGEEPDDDEDDDTPDPGTVKLRRANLISSLMEEGYTGKRAKAVARLLDDVEYDDDDEPENLEDALEAAKKSFGKDLLRMGKPKPPSGNGKEGGDDGDKPSLTAEELAFAKAFKLTPEEYAANKAIQPPPPKKKEKKSD